MAYLKKTISGPEITLLIKSSNILKSVYNHKTKELIITFVNGSRYRYTNVSNETYTEFQMSDSQGKYFNKHIRNLDFTKLDEAEDLETTVTEIEKLTNKEEKVVSENGQDSND